MYTKNIFAAGALLSTAAAIPLANWKRDLVWVTQTENEVVTVPVTTTVWVDPTPSVDSSSDAPHYGHHHRPSSSAAPPAPASTTEAAPSSYAAPSSSSSSSSYVAPSSSSIYVAPSSTYVAPSSTYVAPSPSSTSVYVAPTSTSQYIAPTDSTSVYVAPTPSTTSTSVWVAPTTSSSAGTPTSYDAAPAAPTCTNAASGQSLTGAGASGTSYSGDLTYYGPGMGACGCVSAEGDAIVAISESLFDQYMPASGNPNLNPLCGRQVSITGADGSAYTASIVDRCTGCKEEDLDLTETFFNKVTNNGDGRVHNMKWSFIN